MAAIWAGRTAPGRRIVVLESASKPGAKILISGGGRCNVTNAAVSAGDFAGSSPAAIAKVLRRFDVAETRRFFQALGVELKEEPRGKLFPVGDRARTVLDALLAALAAAGATLQRGARVERIERQDRADGKPGDFRLAGDFGAVTAARVVLATGGMSLPETGSDGHGYALARALGHTTTAAIFPALVPLCLPGDHFLGALRGVSVPEAALELRSSTGRRLRTDKGPLLLTHFGLSGPVVLDASRHFLAARRDDPGVSLAVSFWPDVTTTTSDLDRELTGLRPAQALAHLKRALPERLARALLAAAAAAAGAAESALPPAEPLRREVRQALARAVTDLALPIAADRGFRYAEVTAGGVPLAEVDLATMESRRVPGLYFTGEILDVDGRIGGFNFQWAWASGYTAGVAAGRALAADAAAPGGHSQSRRSQ
jgi:predicted Rossmann fold flavoprotein